MANPISDKPILIVGASYENAVTPISNDLLGPFGGFAVGFGSYLSLGNALVRDERLNGFVINEAVAGATTYTRNHCGPDACIPLGWQGMDVQLGKALTRVAVRDAMGNIVDYNADYLVIGTPNDCLHSGASSVPQASTSPCTYQEPNEAVDRLRDLGLRAVSAGITPVYTLLPQYSDWDLPFFQIAFGLTWVIDEMSLNEFRTLMQTRIQAEVPEAVFVDAWAEFEHLGDGLHPNAETTKKAAKRIAQAIELHAK